MRMIDVEFQIVWVTSSREAKDVPVSPAHKEE